MRRKRLGLIDRKGRRKKAELARKAEAARTRQLQEEATLLGKMQFSEMGFVSWSICSRKRL